MMILPSYGGIALVANDSVRLALGAPRQANQRRGNNNIRRGG